MKRTEIIKPEEARERGDLDGALIFDGDGDGTSAATIYTMAHPGRYVAITNSNKHQRDLVRKIEDIMPIAPKNMAARMAQEEIQRHRDYAGYRFGVFDLAAEDNAGALRSIVDKGGLVDFLDHHTQNRTLVPQEANDFTQKDRRDNSTSTIAYELAERAKVLDEIANKRKATQLAIIGLANDGKGTASQRFGDLDVDPIDREDLIRYAKAINYGAGSEKMDSLELLKGLVKTDEPITYLRESEIMRDLVEARKSAIEEITSRAKISRNKEVVLYVLPHRTENDRQNSTEAYNEFLNGQMARDPIGTYIAVLQTPEGKWRFSGRNGDRRALEMMNSLARNYGAEARGRTTAAGFDTDRAIDLGELWKTVQEVVR